MLAGTVMLGDLDDFITPAQSCVNPLFAGSTNAGKRREGAASGAASASASARMDERGVARIALDSDFLAVAGGAAVVPKPGLIKTTVGNTAKVSLNDCLACSGCVTSAETVLITQQSAGEVYTALVDPRYRVRVASVAPQALASLAAHFGLPSVLDAYARVTTWLQQLGFDAVVDTSVCTQLALLESCHEFTSRMERAGVLRTRTAASSDSMPALDQKSRRPNWRAPPASLAVSSTHIQRVAETSEAGTATAIAEPERAARVSPFDRAELPVLASSCPGWVCYAEKTTPEALPYISCVKSPQQLTGSCIKYLLTDEVGVRHLTRHRTATPVCGASEVYHVSIMACYDRKLEASRKDFYWETATSKEVDCVLTSSELVDMLQARGEDLASMPPTPRRPRSLDEHMDVDDAGAPPSAARVLAALSEALCGVNAAGTALVAASAEHAASDAYVDAMYRFTAERAGVPAEGPLPFVLGRNTDFQEATLADASGAPLATFVLAYGFRNIQTIINKMKRGKCGFHYVEIMACPSGCINGGGQTRAAVPTDPAAMASGDNPLLLAAQAAKQRLHSATLLLHACEPVRPWRYAPAVQLREWLHAVPDADRRAELLYTRYHHIPKLEAGVTKW